jgi:hypothetical protein
LTEIARVRARRRLRSSSAPRRAVKKTRVRRARASRDLRLDARATDCGGAGGACGQDRITRHQSFGRGISDGSRTVNKKSCA